MADITYTQFPIEADIVDISQMETDIGNAQTDILNLGQNKADKTTTINGYSLASNRTLYVQDIPSKNLFDPIKAGFVTRNNYGVTRSLASDGTGIVLDGLSTGTSLWARSTDDASFWLPQGDYLISYEASGTGGSSVTYFGVLTSGGQTYYDSFTAPSGGITIVNFVIVVTNNVQYNCTVYPMIRPSSAPSGYVPYAMTNVEVTSIIDGNPVSVTPTNVTITNNDSRQFGKLVCISIRASLSASVSDGHDIITGLPLPLNSAGLGSSSGLIPVTTSIPAAVVVILADGRMYVSSGTIPAGNIFMSATYICK